MISLSRFVKITWSSTRRISRFFSISNSLSSWIFSSSAMRDLSAAFRDSYTSTLNKIPKINACEGWRDQRFVFNREKEFLALQQCAWQSHNCYSLPRVVISCLVPLCDLRQWAFFSPWLESLAILSYSRTKNRNVPIESKHVFLWAAVSSHASLSPLTMAPWFVLGSVQWDSHREIFAPPYLRTFISSREII